MNESSVVFKNRWVQIIFGTILVVAGVLAATFACLNVDNFTLVIAIVLAVCCFIIGAVYIVSSFITELKSLFPSAIFIGSFAVAIGVLLCANYKILNELMIYLVGTLLLAVSVAYLIKGLLFIKIKTSVTPIVVLITLATILSAGGILVFVFRNDPVTGQCIYVTVGAIIGLIGLGNIILGIKYMFKERNEVKVVKEDEPKEPKKEKKLLKLKKKEKEPELIEAKTEEEPKVIEVKDVEVIDATAEEDNDKPQASEKSP